MEKGFFICIEGPDYSGKDTQAKKLAEWLKEIGYTVEYGNEPDERYPLGRSIKDVL